MGEERISMSLTERERPKVFYLVQQDKLKQMKPQAGWI